MKKVIILVGMLLLLFASQSYSQNIYYDSQTMLNQENQLNYSFNEHEKGTLILARIPNETTDYVLCTDEHTACGKSCGNKHCYCPTICDGTDTGCTCASSTPN